MIKKISAIVAAAISAGFIVTSVPGLAPPVEARTTVEPSAPGTIDGNAVATKNVDRAAVELVRNGSRDPKIVCAQSWPNYGPDCLRGKIAAGGKARVVRVIATDRNAAKRIAVANR